MKELKTNITHYKILDAVLFLNKKHEYPSEYGLYKLLTGIIDEETKNYLDVPSFATLISFNSKKICRYILPLLRYGYLNKIYDKESDELYLVLTNKGIETLEKFHKRHKKPYIKKEKSIKKTIVKIEK